MPTQPYNYFKHFLLPFSSFLSYNNITIPSLDGFFEAFEPYTFATFAVSAPPTSSILGLEATEASSSAESSFNGEADDASVGEVFFNISKYFLTIWAVMYANIE